MFNQFQSQTTAQSNVFLGPRTNHNIPHLPIPMVVETVEPINQQIPPLPPTIPMDIPTENDMEVEEQTPSLFPPQIYNSTPIRPLNQANFWMNLEMRKRGGGRW